MTRQLLRQGLVWIGLVLLALGSIAVSRAESGAFRAPVCLGIATVMALLVILYFMELAHERFSAALSPCLAVTLVILLVSLIAVDVATRTTFPKAVLPYEDPQAAPFRQRHGFGEPPSPPNATRAR